MTSVDSIRRGLNSNGDIGEIRKAIADLIVDQLRLAGTTLGYWEKVYFANAIAALAWNLRSRHQPTASWLHLCLANVEKALVPADCRNESYTPRDYLLDALTLEQLTEELEVVRHGG